MFRIFVCFAFFLIAGCKPVQPDPARLSESASAAKEAITAPATASACVDGNFDEFLQRIMGDAVAQKAAVAGEVTRERIDPNAQPEPVTVAEQVASASLAFPLIPRATDLAREGREYTVAELASGDHELTIRVPDSGIQQRYLFKATPCWTLVKISDDTV